jgi:hypothetical protein
MDAPINMSPQERAQWLIEKGLTQGWALITTSELLEIQASIEAYNMTTLLLEDAILDANRINTLEYLFNKCKIMMKIENKFPAWYYMQEGKFAGPFIDMRAMIDHMVKNVKIDKFQFS